MYFYFEKEIEMLDKVTVLRFIPPAEMFGDHITNPDNACYCYPADDFPNSCLGAGFLSLQGCLHGKYSKIFKF